MKMLQDIWVQVSQSTYQHLCARDHQTTIICKLLKMFLDDKLLRKLQFVFNLY